MKQRLVSRDGFGLSRKNSLLVLFLIYLLTGCSSGGGGGSSDTGTSQDATLYQQALNTYQAGDYSQALSDFQTLVAQYPNSIYVDNAYYYSARCHHELAQFTTARNSYEDFVKTFPASNYVDNAEFYHGKSYFDEAGSQIDVQTEFNLLQTAATELQVFTTKYSASSLLDDAQYYLGRSYHDQAGLLLKDSTLSTGITPGQLFAQARTNYDSVIADTTSVYADNAQYYKAQAFHDEGDFANARTQYSVLITAGVSNWADDAKYQYAKTYYDEAVAEAVPATALGLFGTAIVYFDEMLNSTNPLYQTSNRLDSAYYFKGRSYQRQGDLIAVDANLGDMAATYNAARSVFQQFLDTMPASTWADNALFQIGATYYAEGDAMAKSAAQEDAGGNTALALSLYTTSQQKLNEAITAFNQGFLALSANYPASTYTDNAQYYLGRSYHIAADIPASYRVDLSGDVAGIDFTAITYADARAGYLPLTTDPKFATSSWIDNAYYEIGNTYYAEVPGAADAVATYNNALSAYSQVISGYAGSSVREDNSAYKMGMIYHDTGYCEAEKAALDYTLTIVNISTTIRDDINNNHMPDLDIALANLPTITPTGTHSCVTTDYPGINTTYFNGTLNTVSLEQQLFTGGVNLYETTQYTSAIDQFNTQLMSYPQGKFADDAHLYIGRSNYHLAGAAVAPQDVAYYSAAENEFTLILTDFSSGDVVDGAHYWLGKTYDATNQFTLARTQYELVPQGSGWYDGSLYAIGKTYYDESKTAADPAAVLSLLLSAEQHLSTAVQSMSAGSLSHDDAVYFLARTYHEIGNLLGANPTLTASLSAKEYFNLARNSYQAVVSVSNYADNAAYQIAKTYYEEADFLLPVEAMTAYDQAVAQFQNFLNDTNFVNSSVRDSVYYFQGRSLYKQAQLVKINPQLVVAPTDADTYFTQSRDSFSALLAMIPVSATWNDDAQYYLARSYHEQLNPDYVSARDAYQVLVADQTSPWADDAKYQLGKTYYDEARGLADPVLAINAYASAVLHFDAFIITPIDPLYQFPASNRAEEARFYKGRSMHEHAMLVINNPSNPNVAGDTTVLFSEARIAYASVQALDPLAAFADNAQYYIGKSYYDEANALTNTTGQMNGFEQAALAWLAFDPLTGAYKDSSYAHEGLYFLGRARQQQGELLLKDPTLLIIDDAAVTFDKARAAFQDCIANDSAGVYADNAQYQIGAAYYVEANDFAKSAAQEDAGGNTALALSLYTTSQQKLNSAITTFEQGFLALSANYPASTYSDNAQYYFGRSYHIAAEIPPNYRVDLSGNIAGIDFTLVTYADARAGYLPLTTNSKFATSTWIDNAYYEIGNTYFAEAESAIDNPTKEAALNNALASYFNVVSGYPSSIRYDNAVFQIAWIYHLGEYCALELEWFNYHATLANVSASDASVRDSHVTDLLAVPSSHVCPTSPALLLSNYTAPPV